MAPLLYVPHSDAQNQQPITLLDALIVHVGDDESHPLASLMGVVGALIEGYENEHIPELA